MSATRLFSLLLLWAVGSAGAATAAETSSLHYSKPEVRKEVVAVVEAQLAAFRAHDYARAYSFAARGLREQVNARQFAAMITRGYPVIAQNQRAEFGLPMDDGTAATVTVDVFSADGRSASYRYALLKEAAGWRIAAVVENKARGTDA